MGLRARQAPLSSLTPAAFNPRRIDPVRFEALKRSLQDDTRMLEARPVIALPDGTVIAGNMRVRAALELGWKTIPTVTVDLGPEQARVWMLRDNNEYGEWDNDRLAELLRELERAGVDLELTGFSHADLDDLFRQQLEDGTVDEDDVPEPPAGEPRSKTGEVYELGEHRLLCADARDAGAVSSLVGGGLAEMVWTDPPYGVDYTDSRGRSIKNDALGEDALYDLVRTVLENALAGTAGGGAIYVAHSDVGATLFRRAFVDAGWSLRQGLVWVKDSFVLGRQDYQWQHEPILYGWKPGAAHRWNADFAQSTVHDDELDLRRLSKKELVQLVLEMKNAKNTTVARQSKPARSDLHPTMKPVGLIAGYLLNSSRRGEIVLDPFAGSGSTMIAAQRTGRRALLVELDPRWCDVIRQRYEDFVAA